MDPGSRLALARDDGFHIYFYGVAAPFGIFMTDLKKHYDVAVVGGGAAGMVAAISAKREGASVLLLEKLPRLGKKVLASGAGRCNLSNDTIDPSFYNSEAKEVLLSVFRKFGKQEILGFFRELGLAVYSDGGKIYPVTDQAASVADVLELELSRLGVETRCQCEVTDITPAGERFTLALKDGAPVSAGSVLIAGGGKSYPSFGSDGGAYRFASRFGHTLIDPVPSAVPLVASDPWCHLLQGQKVIARVAAVIDGKTGRRVEDDLLFTKYGLSGTAILDISEEISVAINRLRKKDVSVVVNLVPFMEEEELRKELATRLKKGIRPEKLLTGLLPHKFAGALSDILKKSDLAAIARYLRNRKFSVTGTRGWNEAEFTAGGIDTREIYAETLKSKLRSGLYFAGEILNVQGRRGGYNLAWAWASGFIAGRSAAGKN